jgi:hypothetical protein
MNPTFQRSSGSHDADTLAAIHSFFRFQIQEHQTGDSLEEQK